MRPRLTAKRVVLGVDKGIPDILVPIPGLGCYLGIEVKRAGTVRWSSVEQESAYVAGHFVLAQSLEDVTAALISLSCRIPASNKFCEMVSRFEAIVRGCGRG